MLYYVKLVKKKTEAFLVLATKGMYRTAPLIIKLEFYQC